MELNRGHGHVTPRPDGVKARCGGPSLCPECAREQATKQQQENQITLTEEQLAVAKEVLLRRDIARAEQYQREYFERQRAAEEKFQAAMKAKYPNISWDEMDDIYNELRDFYE